jgi:hypothetical protein
MRKINDVLQKDLTLGTKICAHGLTVFPILSREVQTLPELDTLDNALLNGTVSIREVTAEGEVPHLIVDNGGDRPLLILDGEEILGKELKQNRIINTTVLILSNTICRIPVSCVEQGRWRQQSQDIQPAQSIFRTRSRIIQKQSVTKSLRHNGTYRGDQQEIWQEVSRSLDQTGARSRTSSYTDAREHVSHRLERIVDAIKPVAGQVGAVFAARHEILGIEILGSSSLFAASVKKIARSFAFEVVVMDEHDGSLTEKVRTWWENFGAAEFSIHESPGAGKDIRVENENLIGSGLMWNQLVHLSCFPKPQETVTHAPTRRSSAEHRRRSMLRSTSR